MFAEIISIGNELLAGETINTNASFIARELMSVGVEVCWITAVGDNESHIFQTLRHAETRADVIIATGGLGPTHDDITKKVFAQFFDSEMVFNEKILNKLRDRFRKRNIEMPRCNEAQAYVPEKAKILDNPIGTAPALLFEKEGKLFFALPGVPVEMEQIVKDSIVPLLKKRQKRAILQRVIHTIGIPESTLFSKLSPIAELEKHCKVAFLPQIGRVDIRLTALAENERVCQEKISLAEKIIVEKADGFIWGFDDQTLESLAFEKLRLQNRRLAVIEINTRGKIISQLLENINSEFAGVKGFVFSGGEQFFDFLNPDNLKDFEEILSDEIELKRIFSSLQKKVRADLILLVLLSEKGNGDAYIAILGEEKIFHKKDTLPFKKNLALLRLRNHVSGLLYQYLRE